MKPLHSFGIPLTHIILKAPPLESGDLGVGDDMLAWPGIRLKTGRKLYIGKPNLNLLYSDTEVNLCIIAFLSAARD